MKFYIYRLIDENGNYYIGESPTYPELSGVIPSNQIKLLKESTDLSKVTKELVTETTDYDLSLVKFNESIKLINSDHRFKLMNGRFRVDEYLKSNDINYLLVIKNLKTNKYFIDVTKNVIDKLYRIFNDNRGYSKLVSDIQTYGRDNFYVEISGPYSYDQALVNQKSKFETILNYDESNVYNLSRYNRL